MTKAVTCWLLSSLSSKEETKSECCFLPHSCLIPTFGQIKTHTSASRQHRDLLMLSSKSQRTRLHSCGRQEGLGQTAVIRDGGVSAMAPPWFYGHTIPRELQWLPKHDRQLMFFLTVNVKI